jgi:hypothetical protein
MDFVTGTGAKVKVQAASLEEAVALKNAIQKEIANGNVTIPLSKLDDLRTLGLKADIDLGAFIEHFMRIDGSKEVFECLFVCLSRCTYNGHRITKETFDDLNARKDYYDVIFACAKENLSPFFLGLVSKLRALNEIVQNPSQT